ncbi:MoaD/ThiS family protein [Mycolicibacterium neoaurum]|uniref:MoaD/ThiS family protein n=1 Tax=Mycolicibacterium neoaurum TaxID=1795 RepID=UPI001F4D0E49|nr:MoaD/ThiS family protein [Mycolicibacterium neoaurum]
MPVTVVIPTILRSYTEGQKRVFAAGATLCDVIADLDANYTGIAQRLLEDGELRKFINIYINDDDSRFVGGMGAILPDGVTITILSAVAGG